MDGKTLWKKNRDTRNGWSTPAVVEYGGKTQVITTASRQKPGKFHHSWKSDKL